GDEGLEGYLVRPADFGDFSQLRELRAKEPASAGHDLGDGGGGGPVDLEDAAQEHLSCRGVRRWTHQVQIRTTVAPGATHAGHAFSPPFSSARRRLTASLATLKAARQGARFAKEQATLNQRVGTVSFVANSCKQIFVPSGSPH